MSESDDSIKPSLRARLLGSGFEGAVWAGLLMGVFVSPLLAQLVPEEPFDLWPWSKAFADFIAAWVPNVGQLTSLSKMPQVTQLFMSTLWVVWFPICAVLFFRLARPTEQTMLRTLRVTQSRWWYLLTAQLVPPLGACKAALH